MGQWMNRETSEFETLIGKTVVGVLTDVDHFVLCFITREGYFAYSAEGDCCSTSWIAHINGLFALVGHKVNSVTVREMPDDTEEDRGEVIKHYGWTLNTDAGRCDIEIA